MNKIKEYKWIILTVILIFGLGFYWFLWKPTEIRKNCFQSSYSYVYYPSSEENRSAGNAIDFNYKYLECVRFFGLPN